jgi:hypothetical protein
MQAPQYLSGLHPVAFLDQQLPDVLAGAERQVDLTDVDVSVEGEHLVGWRLARSLRPPVKGTCDGQQNWEQQQLFFHSLAPIRSP